MNPQHTLSPRHKVTFSGKNSEYFKIWFVNLLLTIVTLGIYSAWATVRRRRYFLLSTEIADGHFDYHARPVQILIGRLVLVAFLVIFFFASAVLPVLSDWLLLLLILALPWLIVRSWRFQARMTSYRGAHFNFTSSFGQAYYRLLLQPLLLIICLIAVVSLYLYHKLNSNDLTTLFSALPVILLTWCIGMAFIQAIVSQQAWSLYINGHHYGDYTFSAVLRKAAFIRIMLTSLLILLPFMAVTFGVTFALFNAGIFKPDMMAELQAETVMQNSLSSLLIYIPLLAGFWFSANYQFIATRNYVFHQTTMGGILFLKSSLGYFRWMRLLLGNLLLIIVTLGLAIPLAQLRCARYLAECFWLEGELPNVDKANGATEKIAGAIAEEFAPVEGVDLGL